MIGLNHALTGGLIALTTPVIVAIPLAFMSHFILDVIPHYGIPHKKRNESTTWKLLTISDFILTFSLAVVVIINRPEFMLIVCPLLATSPDYIWVGRVIQTRSFDLSINTNKFTRWHARIQGLERPWGLWIEIPYAIIMSYLVFVVYW